MIEYKISQEAIFIKKKEIYKVKPLIEGKKNIISTLIEEYDIKTTENVQDWQNRPLEKSYPVLFIEATHFSVSEDNRIKKQLLMQYQVLQKME